MADTAADDAVAAVDIAGYAQNCTAKPVQIVQTNIFSFHLVFSLAFFFSCLNHNLFITQLLTLRSRRRRRSRKKQLLLLLRRVR